MSEGRPRLTPGLVLRAYAAGVFPMAESAHSRDIHWYDPLERGVLPLTRFHVPRRLRRTLRTAPVQVRVDTAFEPVMRFCAGRDETWINIEIVEVFSALFRDGYAHSVEVWEDETLIGGLYGVALGAAFFGESMFSHRRDASKIALVHLVARLRAGGFTLLDTQFVTEHLRQFGAVEISRAAYRVRLRDALQREADFYSSGVGSELSALLTQSRTQMS